MNKNEKQLQWLGPPISCPDQGVHNKEFIYYSACQLDQNQYASGTAVITLLNKKCRLGTIRFFYENPNATISSRKYRVGLDVFYRVNEIADKLDKPNDLNNDVEVIKNDRIVIVDLPVNSIKTQCTIVFCLPDEDPEEVLTEHISSTPYALYVCRYLLQDRAGRYNLKPALSFDCYTETADNISEKSDLSDEDDCVIVDANVSQYAVTKVQESENNIKISIKRTYSVSSLTDTQQTYKELTINDSSPSKLLMNLNLSDCDKNVDENIFSDEKTVDTTISPSSLIERINLSENLPTKMESTETGNSRKNTNESNLKSKVIAEICMSPKRPVVKLHPLPENILKDKNIDSDINTASTPLKRSSRVRKPVTYFDNAFDLTSPVKRSSRIRKSTTFFDDYARRRSTRLRTPKSYVTDETDETETNRTRKRTTSSVYSETIEKPARSRAKSVDKDTPKPSVEESKIFVDSPVDENLRITRSRSNSIDVDTPKPTKLTPKKLSYTKYSREIKTVKLVRTYKSPKERRTEMDVERLFEKTPEKSGLKIGGQPLGRKRLSGTNLDQFLESPVKQMKVLQTPKLKLVLKNLTPSIEERDDALDVCKTPMQLARANLAAYNVPSSVPCRETEYLCVYDFVSGRIRDRAGGCMYISGMPGTGKTMTVCKVMNDLETELKKRKIPDFLFLKLNALSVTEPRQIYVEMVKKLFNKTLHWEEALETIVKFFIKKNKNTSHVILIDELDKLCNKKQDVIYNLLELPFRSKTPLVVITIANTMNLPERLLSNKVNSRLGLVRLTFKPYIYKDLVQIVSERLSVNKVFKNEALELVARKVAAVSGDARRALTMCTRAIEIAEEVNSDLVTMAIVDRAVKEMLSSDKVQAIKGCCSRLERLILMTISTEVTRTGNEEVPLNNVLTNLRNVCYLEQIEPPSFSVCLRLCQNLSSCRLLIMQHGRLDLNMTLMLNISSDEIHYALS